MNAVMLNVIMLNVVAPIKRAFTTVSTGSPANSGRDHDVEKLGIWCHSTKPGQQKPERQTSAGAEH